MRKHYSKEYRKMMKKYQKEAIKLSKECKPWDSGWSIEFLINHLKWMKEYYTLNENVHSVENCLWDKKTKYTRLEMIDKILNVYNTVENYRFDLDYFASLSEEERKTFLKQRKEIYNNLKHEFYMLLEEYMPQLWD